MMSGLATLIYGGSIYACLMYQIYYTIVAMLLLFANDMITEVPVLYRNKCGHTPEISDRFEYVQSI